MSVALLVMTDGREHIHQVIPSILEHVHGDFTRRIIHDDSGNPRNWQRLARAFPDFELVASPHRLGFGGAIQNAWRHVVPCIESHVFAAEDDFMINGPVDLEAMASVLDANPYLVQLVLKRQAWNPQERDAGGIIEQHPDDYLQRVDDNGNRWIEHRRFFSTNTYLARTDLCWQPWPSGAHSEGRFTHRLLRSPEARFAFWGDRNAPPAIHHVGDQRVGVGY